MFDSARLRKFQRYPTKRRSSLLVNRGMKQVRFPSLIVDSSQNGFRLRCNLQLRKGQMVEVILDEALASVRCTVVWVGDPGSKQEGEAGLRTVSAS
jgi:hypothetical protein